MGKINNPWQKFLELCQIFKYMDDLEAFLDIFLTISEREELPKRVNIVRELLKGELSQREIAKKLKVSIANITRASNIIKSTKYDLHKLLNIKNKNLERIDKNEDKFT